MIQLSIEIDDKLPQGWSSNLLKEVLEKLTDGSHNPPKKQTHGLPMLSARNIENGHINFHEYRYIDPNDFAIEDKRTQIKSGDVLLTIVGAIGRATIVPDNIEPFTVQRSVAVLSSLAFTPKFLMFQFRSPKIQRELLSKAKGTAQKGIYLKKLSGVEMLIPPLNEQKRIVTKIEALQTRSTAVKEELSAIKPLLNQFRQSVLAAAFRGDLTKDWRSQNPDVEPAEVLLERIRVERRRRWEEAELEKMTAKGKVPKNDKWKKKYKEPEPINTEGLPELPNGWCWGTWEQVGFCQNGRAFPSKYYQSNGVKLLRPGNLHVSGQVQWTETNTKYLSEEWETKHPTYIIYQNELLVNLTAQSLADEFLGRICLTSDNEKCLLNQRIARLSPVEIKEKFILWLFKSRLFRRYVDSLNTGSLIQHMFTSQIYEFIFPIPPFEEQKEIVRRIESLFKLADNIEQQYQQAEIDLETLNQSILAKAFRGELISQDPNDEPASVLLERIKEERDKAKATAKKSKTKKTKKRSSKKKDEQLGIPGM